MSTNAYESPFSSRYASEEMQYVFSQDNKFKTWRKLWIALAKQKKHWESISPMNRLQSLRQTKKTSTMRLPVKEKNWFVTM